MGKIEDRENRMNKEKINRIAEKASELERAFGHSLVYPDTKAMYFIGLALLELSESITAVQKGVSTEFHDSLSLKD